MEIMYDGLLFPKWWFCNSLLHWQDIIAGYETDCFAGKKKLHYFSLKLHLMAFGSFWHQSWGYIFCRKANSSFHRTHRISYMETPLGGKMRVCWKPIFGLFLSGPLRQVLLYITQIDDVQSKGFKQSGLLSSFIAGGWRSYCRIHLL